MFLNFSWTIIEFLKMKFYRLIMYLFSRMWQQILGKIHLARWPLNLQVLQTKQMGRREGEVAEGERGGADYQG